MTKFPFSNEGFQALQQNLYALSDPDLFAVSNRVFNHFNEWMAENFDLSPSQIDFLETLSPKMTNFLSAQTAMAIGNRLPVTLTKPDGKSENLRGTKLIRPSSEASATSEGEEGFEVEGNLDIEIIY